MRHKLSQEPWLPATTTPASGTLPGERRGGLMGTEPGPCPGRRRGQPSSACKIASVDLAEHVWDGRKRTFPSVAARLLADSSVIVWHSYAPASLLHLEQQVVSVGTTDLR